MKIKFKKIHGGAVIPTKGSEFAGCWDVTCTNIISSKDNDIVVAELGFAIEIPTGYVAVLVPRSSFTASQWLVQNSPGQIDSDYRGMCCYKFRALPIGVKNIGTFFKPNYKFVYPEFPYKVGERIGQMYLRKIIPLEFEEVTKLSTTKRGSGGFGSTNK